MRVTQTCGAVALLSVMVVVPMTTPAPAVGSGCSGAWSVVPNPATPGSQLFDVAAFSPTDAWAVGFGWDHGLRAPLVEHWDGVRWTIVHVPSPAQWSSLHGVSVVAPDDVWAVGQQGVIGSETLVEHWDGSSWSIVPSPNPSPTANYLYAVAAIEANDVWAVGMRTEEASQTLIEHWDGHAWRVVKGAQLGDGVNYLLGVSGTSPGDVWVAGQSTGGHGGFVEGLMEHWNGTTWSAQVMGPPRPEPAFLTGVSVGSPGVVLATGGHDEGLRTLAVEVDGSTWAFRQSEEVPRTINFLNDISADPAGDAWTVGYYYIPGDSQSQTLVEQWDGNAWHIFPSPNEGAVSSLSGVFTVSSNEAWAVGDGVDENGASKALIEHYCAPEGNR